jgi:hypothetical protein
LDIDSFFLCAAVNHSLKRHCKQMNFKYMNVPMMGKMLHYWLGYISMTEILQFYHN